MAAVIDRWGTEPERQGRGKRWQVRWKDDLRADRRKAFDRKSDAYRFAREIERQLDIGTYQDPRVGDVPFGEFSIRWLESRYDLRPPTVSLYTGFLRNHLIPEVGGVHLSRMRPAHGREYMASRKARGVSDTTLRKTMVLAKQILKAAVEEGLIATNPFGPVKLPRQHAREMRFLTPEQLNNLLESMTPHYCCMVLTAAVLGLRFGEVTGLRPEDLDLLHGQVMVTGQLAEWHGKPQRVEPKTDASFRTVAIPDVLKVELEDQLSQRSSAQYLFTSRSGGPIRKSNFNRRHWQPAVRAAGLEGLVFHELRHTAVAFAIDAGAHPRAIQARLGHASITTTLDVYGHRMPGLDDRLAEALDARLRETLAPLRRPRAQNDGF